MFDSPISRVDGNAEFVNVFLFFIFFFSPYDFITFSVSRKINERAKSKDINVAIRRKGL